MSRCFGWTIGDNCTSIGVHVVPSTRYNHRRGLFNINTRLLEVHRRWSLLCIWRVTRRTRFSYSVLYTCSWEFGTNWKVCICWFMFFTSSLNLWYHFDKNKLIIPCSIAESCNGHGYKLGLVFSRNFEMNSQFYLFLFEYCWLHTNFVRTYIINTYILKVIICWLERRSKNSGSQPFSPRDTSKFVTEARSTPIFRELVAQIYWLISILSTEE